MSENPEQPTSQQAGERKAIGEQAERKGSTRSPPRHTHEEDAEAGEDKWKAGRQSEEPEEGVWRELQLMREAVEELRSDNHSLANRVEYLEEAVDQKDKRISHLTDLMNNLTNQLKDLIQYENSLLKQHVSKDIKAKFEEMEKGLTGKVLMQSQPMLFNVDY